MSLPEELCAKYEEERRGEKIGEGFRNQRGYRVAEDSGEDGHGNESAEGRTENDHAGMSHCHKRSHEERFITNFGEENHREGEY